MAKTDKKTLELIAQVKQKREEIARLDKPRYKTNCLMRHQDGSLSNLHVEADLRRLIECTAFLEAFAHAYAEAAKTLGLTDAPEFTWQGYTLADWLGDIKARIGKIQIQARRKQLETMEARLRKLISPEMQAELELADIEKELGG